MSATRANINKSDNLPLKMRAQKGGEGASFMSSGEARLAKWWGHDDQSLYKQQVPGLRALCLHRGHALRFVPLRSEERAEDQRRGGRWDHPPEHQRGRALKEDPHARCQVNRPG
jgi:hypothetical protein